MIKSENMTYKNTNTKIHSFLNQCCSVYENKVLQLMSACLRLKRFRESTMFSQTEDRANTVVKSNGLQAVLIFRKNIFPRNHEYQCLRKASPKYVHNIHRSSYDHTVHSIYVFPQLHYANQGQFLAFEQLYGRPSSCFLSLRL